MCIWLFCCLFDRQNNIHKPNQLSRTTGCVRTNETVLSETITKGGAAVIRIHYILLRTFHIMTMSTTYISFRIFSRGGVLKCEAMAFLMMCLMLELETNWYKEHFCAHLEPLLGIILSNKNERIIIINIIIQIIIQIII